MLSIVNGELMHMIGTNEFDCVIHGCNCMSHMGGGVAALLACTFPLIAEVDHIVHYAGGPEGKLGKVSLVLVERVNTYPLMIINAYTQLSPGPDFQMKAFVSAMTYIARLVSTNIKILIPKIGSGIGGGNWTDIELGLTQIFKNHNVVVVNHDK